MTYKVISFYKYVKIEYPEGLRDYFRILCQDHNLLGRILVGKEGINAAISGKTEDINNFQNILANNPLFSGITYREQPNDKITHHKLVVKVRKEIVVLGKEVDMDNAAEYLSPEQLKEWYENNEDFIILDTRNDYEFEVGRFSNAVNLNIKNFSDFPNATKSLEKHKEKTIVTYCTGGIRCEKASAYLKQNGFKKVYQFEGGIVNYLNKFQDYWEGGLFVFDDRLVHPTNKVINKCSFCEIPTDLYSNCFNLDCDKLFIACKECQEENNYACSKECMGSPRQRGLIRNA